MKPISQSKKAKENFSSPLIDYLLDHHTKEEIEAFLNCSNRTARDQIMELSMYYPVISTSKTPGYKRAGKIEELSPENLKKEYDDVCITIREHNSRVKALKKKMKSLIAWKKVAEKFLTK